MDTVSLLPLILGLVIAASTFCFVMVVRTKTKRNARSQDYLRHEIARLDMERHILELQLEAEVRRSTSDVVTRKVRSNAR